MRRAVLVFLVVIGAVAVLAALVPFTLSTQIVKQRIADQIAEWTGRRVTFTGNPRIALIPDLKISIDNVIIADPGGVKPLATMRLLSGKLRIAALLVGRIEITEFRLDLPVVHLRRDAQGAANWNLRPRLGDGKEKAWRSGPRPVLDLRRVRIRDGRFVFDDAATERHEVFSAASLFAQWPSASEAATGTGTFTWRGERVEFNGSIGDPIALIEGKPSPTRFALASTPIRAVFTGKTTRLSDFQFEGATTLSTPSLRRLAAWLGAAMPEGAVLGAGLIEGNVNWAGQTIAFSDVHLELDGNVADGSVSANLGHGLPSIQGTLAFETLDLSPYVEAYRAALSAEGSWREAVIRLPILTVANVDLRVSAGQLLVGSWRMGHIAIAGTARDGQFTLDVGDTRPYGGTLAATARGGLQDGMFVGSLNARMTDVAAGIALRDLAGVSALDGTGTFSVSLDGHGQNWNEVASQLQGTGKLTLADGSISGLDITRLAARLRGEGMAGDDGTGLIRLVRAACSLTIASGAVTTGDLRIEGADFGIEASVEASLLNGGLSGLGTLTATGSGQAVGFELAGTWKAPEFFPDLEQAVRRSEALPSAGPSPPQFADKVP